MMFGFHEALRLALEEGLEARFARHERNHRALIAGIEALGLEPAAPAAHRLPMLNPIRVPDGVDEAAVRHRLLADHDLEIGAGLGPLAGKIWRVGVMGASSTPRHVRTFVSAMAEALRAGGRTVPDGATAAVDAIYGNG
jgi:alanine-glyoxylate transaminase/serine-glyoxylate transaminase/serine-pyruvate transaminase